MRMYRSVFSVVIVRQAVWHWVHFCCIVVSLGSAIMCHVIRNVCLEEYVLSPLPYLLRNI